MSDSQRPYGLQPTRLLRPQDFPGKSTAMGCHCLFPPSYLGEKRKDPECDNRVPSLAGTSVLATNLMKEFSECLIWDPGCILEGWREDKKKEGKGILLTL